jgi:hypothetical protein
MRPSSTALVLVCLTTGCTSIGLERASVRQAETWSDIQYQQVLDNLAMFSCNPSAVPFHLLQTGCNPQIADSATVTPSLTFAPTGRSLTSVLGLQGGRTLTENWSTAVAITDLPKIRHLYRVAIGVEAPGPGEEDVHSGWFCAGRKHDVPRDACYVGHYHDRYAWVMPNGVEGLGLFTLEVIEAAATSASKQASLNAASGSNGGILLTIPAVGQPSSQPTFIVPRR